MYQSGRNILVAFAEETVYGTLPAAGGATVFRANRGGMNLTKQPIQSGENRRDGMTTRGRHGQRSVAGEYVADLSVGTFDALMEAALRGTWQPALVITEATAGLTSVTTTANTIVASAGSWITAGLRVGDVIRASDLATAANNDRNLRIVGLTASTITVAETLAVDAAGDTAFTITRPKKLIQGSPIVSRSFTIEESELDIDGSELFKGCRVGRMRVELQPNAMATITFGFAGQDMEVMTGAQSPYYTNPTATASIGLTAVEAAILLGDTPIVDLTAANFEINLNADGTGVVGSVVTPDVFTNQAVMTGQVTGLRQDFSRVQSFLDEDVLSLSLLFAEQEADPADFVAFHIPNLTLATATKSELGQDGPRTQSFDLLVGSDDRGNQYDQTMIKVITSSA